MFNDVQFCSIDCYRTITVLDKKKSYLIMKLIKNKLFLTTNKAMLQENHDVIDE